jgi:hypothetical protein
MPSTAGGSRDSCPGRGRGARCSSAAAGPSSRSGCSG